MPLRLIHYKGKKFDLNYEIIKSKLNSNNQSQKHIIILHGWGSNKMIMKRAFEIPLTTLFPSYNQIYIDLPGFGKSLTNHILTTNDYANIINLLLKSLNIKKNIILGHSFGGKIATLLKPQYLVLLSSAGIVEKKSLLTKIKIFITKFFNIFGIKVISNIFRSNDVKNMDENMYQTFKNVVNEDFSDIFASYKGKTYIFWGQYDKATSIASAKLIHKLIKNSYLKIYNNTTDDHFFFIKNSNDIIATLKTLLSK